MNRSCLWSSVPVVRWVLVLALSAPLALAASAQTPQKTPSRPAPKTTAEGQVPRDDTAEKIISILQEEPALMAQVKQTIRDELNRRGLSAGDSEISNERIFTQIRTNSQVRDAVAEALRSRGYLTTESGLPSEMGETEREEDETTAPAQPTLRDRPEKESKAQPAAVRTPGPKLSTRPNPYRDLQALRDLYTQFSAEDQPLHRFGQDMFKLPEGSSGTTQMELPMGSDYVLGPGDSLTIDIWGSTSQRVNRTVDHEGRISLPESGSVLLAGKTLGAAQSLIEATLKKQFRDVSVDVSVNRLRRVRIYVVGDVKKPGAYEISSLATPLTALLAAGGPSDSGSLRTVRHFRGETRLRDIDLYDLLLHGVRGGTGQLQSGDSILVPPVGPQVWVRGMVKRPAIYELRTEETLAQVLELAGGVLVSGELGNVRVERVEAHQRRLLLNAKVPSSGVKDEGGEEARQFIVSDGDRVTVSPILPYSEKVVYLEGHVFRPGKYPYRDGMTVADLVSFQELLPEPADRAEVIRLQAPDFRPRAFGVELRATLEGKGEPFQLQPFDTLRVLGRYEADAPTVAIYGEVLRPGNYPLSSAMKAADLIRMAGGFKRSAYRKYADLSSYRANGERVVLDHREIDLERAMDGEGDANADLKPGDVLTIRQLGQWTEIGGSITVTGAVVYPGRYGIQQGERLSTVLRRTGGFLQDAYPSGAVLERTQVREISARSKEQLIQRLESQSLDVSAESAAVLATQRQRLIDRLKQAEPNGRLVIRISPNLQEWENTFADIEVRPGDTLYVPKQPNFIVVDGQVYNPSAITFSPGKKAGWYLRQAGGPTEFANRKDIFIVRANGSVVGRSSGFFWGGGVLNVKMNPGDTVVVPEKVATGSPFWRDLAQSAQVVSAIAIAARVATSF